MRFQNPVYALYLREAEANAQRIRKLAEQIHVREPGFSVAEIQEESAKLAESTPRSQIAVLEIWYELACKGLLRELVL